MGDSFAATATRVAGLAGALLGWRPHEFWAATPAELETVLRAFAPEVATPPGVDELTKLKERFPDG